MLLLGKVAPKAFSGVLPGAYSLRCCPDEGYVTMPGTVAGQDGTQDITRSIRSLYSYNLEKER